MSATVSTDFLLRVAQATPEQQAAIDRFLLGLPAQVGGGDGPAAAGSGPGSGGAVLDALVRIEGKVDGLVAAARLPEKKEPLQEAECSRVFRLFGELLAMGPVLEGIHREISALRDEAIKPAAAAQPPTSQGEAERIFAVLQRLRSKRAGMMAPLYDVFVATVLEGRSQRAAAKSCGCSPALLSNRVGELEKEFRLPLKQLQNYAKTLLDMETSVKGQRYARKKHGAPQDEAGQYDEGDGHTAREDDGGYLPEERQDDS